MNRLHGGKFQLFDSMKIYTKSGDKGKTSLLGGKRVPKDHLRIEAIGNIDELNAYVGLVRDLEKDVKRKDFLLEIQKRLFSAGSSLAVPAEKSVLYPLDLRDEDIHVLESAIDEMEKGLSSMKHFILPGGHPRVSHCHIARSICRRAERSVVALSGQEEVSQLIIKYLNRLSDYLFVLARKTLSELGGQEQPWHPRD